MMKLNSENLDVRKIAFALLLVTIAGMLSSCDGADKHQAPIAWRDWDKPSDPRELEAYHFAHAIKLPDSLPKPVPFDFQLNGQFSWTDYLIDYLKHQPGWLLMPFDYEGELRRRVRVAYFDHLCKTEAGEFIYKTVDKVDGLYQMRPMPRRSTPLMQDRYGFEDPADWSQREADGSPTLFIGGPGNGFIFFESPRHPKDSVNEVNFKRWVVNSWDKPEPPPYWKYHDYDYTNSRIGPTADPEATISARYGYTWRGIRRERDREFGIAGGELMVLDLQTNEVLAVRRSFAIAKIYDLGKRVDWEFAYFCPDTMRPDGKKRLVDKMFYPFSFISEVLRPINHDGSKMRFSN